MTLRNILAALATVLLAACVSEQLGSVNACADTATGWKLSPQPPANRPELLDLPSGGQAVGEQLRAGIPLQELWFSDGSDRLMVCRYEAAAEVCPVAITAEFTRASNGWSAGPVESRLCRE